MFLITGTTVPSSTELAEGDQLVKDPSQMAAIATAGGSDTKLITK